MPHQFKQQQPPFKPGMPKPLSGPVRTSQPSPIGGTQSISPIPTGVGQSGFGNPTSGPPGFSNTSGGPPTGQPNVISGTPPIKSDLQPNIPRPGLISNPPIGNQPSFPKPGQTITPPVGNQPTFGGPKPGIPSIGGPTGGPPTGGFNQVKPQGFKPQSFPGKAPIKMPPKMPGSYGGPN